MMHPLMALRSASGRIAEILDVALGKYESCDKQPKRSALAAKSRGEQDGMRAGNNDTQTGPDADASI